MLTFLWSNKSLCHFLHTQKNTFQSILQTSNMHTFSHIKDKFSKKEKDRKEEKQKQNKITHISGEKICEELQV